MNKATKAYQPGEGVPRLNDGQFLFEPQRGGDVSRDPRQELKRLTEKRGALLRKHQQMLRTPNIGELNDAISMLDQEIEALRLEIGDDYFDGHTAALGPADAAPALDLGAPFGEVPAARKPWAPQDSGYAARVRRLAYS